MDERVAFASAMAEQIARREALGKTSAAAVVDDGVHRIEDEEGLPVRFTPSLLRREAAKGDKLAQEYLDTVLHFQAWWRALKAKDFKEALQELGTALRSNEGHFLLGASPYVTQVLEALVTQEAQTPWETPEVAAVSAYLAVLPPQLSGGFPSDPDAFFDAAMQAHPKDTAVYLTKAMALGLPAADALPERASTYRNQGDLAKARDDFEAYFKLDGISHARAYATAHFQYAFVELQGQGPDAAASSLSWYCKGLDAAAKRPAWLGPMGDLDSKDIVAGTLHRMGLVKRVGKLTAKGKELLARRGESYGGADAAGPSTSGSGSGGGSGGGGAGTSGAAAGGAVVAQAAAAASSGARVCAWCKEANPRLKCSGCAHALGVRYCSKQCQNLAWPAHKKACNAAKKSRPA